MAVNQVSIFLFPLRWKKRQTPSPFAKTFEGEPVQVVDAVPNPACTSPPVPPHALTAWLTEKDFIPVPGAEGHIFQRGEVLSMFGPEKEIEVHFDDRPGEVASLYCRFTLPWSRASPTACRKASPVLEWTRFTVELCEQFGLGLGEEAVGPCTASQFLALVRENPNYQSAAARYGWESDSDDQGTLPTSADT